MSRNFAIRPQTGSRAKSVNPAKGNQKANAEEDGKNPALLLFEDDLFAELFNARCHDTGEPVNVEKAKMFKDELMRLNQKRNNVLNLPSLRLGINSIISLSSTLPIKDYTSLNIADNSISDYGMHAVKNIISNTKIEHINLSSNMISEIGLEMLVPDLTKNTRLKTLDFGVVEGSIRKNSLGIKGAKCLAAILLHNKSLETLKLQDNDLGSIGGELIGAALRQNKIIKNLKVSENDLKSEGAEHVLKAGLNLQSLDIGRNNISAKSGGIIKSYIENNSNLRKLNLEFNELSFKGIEIISKALYTTTSLRSLILKGNSLRDEGVQLLAESLEDNQILEELDISLNEITPAGSAYIADILPRTGIRYFNISKNFLGDEAFKQYADRMMEFKEICKLTKMDFSSCRIGDEGILHFLQSLNEYDGLTSLRVGDNFISEKIEKVVVEMLEVNKNLTEFAIHGNRISLSCLSRIRKILARNQKEANEREPNKLKTELYRLQYEQKKIVDAKEKLKVQEKEINKAIETKDTLIKDIEKFKNNEVYKRKALQDKIEEQKSELSRKKGFIGDKKDELEKMKLKHQAEMAVLKGEYEGAVKKKTDLDGDLKQMQESKEKMEDDYMATINHLKGQITNLKKKGEDLKKKEQSLNEEFRMLKMH